MKTQLPRERVRELQEDKTFMKALKNIRFNNSGYIEAVYDRYEKGELLMVVYNYEEFSSSFKIATYMTARRLDYLDERDGGRREALLVIQQAIDTAMEVNPEFVRNPYYDAFIEFFQEEVLKYISDSTRYSVTGFYNYMYEWISGHTSNHEQRCLDLADTPQGCFSEQARDSLHEKDHWEYEAAMLYSEGALEEIQEVLAEYKKLKSSKLKSVS